jgi:integrase
MINQPKGRPRRFAEHDQWLQSLEQPMGKRPKYLDGIGVYLGSNSSTIWIKILVPKGALYKGRSYTPGKSIEIKLGKLSSWSWQKAEAERDRLQGLADRGEPLEEASSPLFRDYAIEWFEHKKLTVRGVSTLKGHVYSDLIPAFGLKRLSDITVRDINRWQEAQLSTGLQPSTVKRKRTTLFAILNKAVSEDVLPKNPAGGGKVASLGKEEPRLRIPTQEEFSRVLHRAREIEEELSMKGETDKRIIRTEPWLVDLLKWSVLSGMRRAESLRARLSDIETYENGNVVLKIHKTKSGEPRLISLNKGMIEIVNKVRAYDRSTTDDRLFAISVGRASKLLAYLWKTCGVEDIRLHDLRRHHVSTLIKSGIDTKTVASRVGHSSLAMIEKHYAVFMGDQDAADAAQASFDRQRA